MSSSRRHRSTNGEDVEMEDFVNGLEHMTNDQGPTNTERSTCNKILKAAIANIVPRRQQDDFLKHYNCCPPPIFIPLITTAEIIIFAVYAAELAKTDNPVGWPSYSPLVYKATRRHEAWRFITYMFIHIGWGHILPNMIIQLFLGLPLEIVHKWWRVMIVYLCGVIAGSLAHSVTDYNISLVGASAGAFALVGAHLAAVITNWKEMNYGVDMDIYPLSRERCRKLRRLVVAYFALETGRAIYSRVTAPDDQKVSVAAHAGGFLCGLLLGVPVMKNINKLPWEMTLGWITMAVFLVFVAFAALFNGLYTGYPPTDWS